MSDSCNCKARAQMGYTGAADEGKFAAMKNKIKKGFAGLADKDLGPQVDLLVEKMTGNSHFPTPNPTLASLAAKCSSFKGKVQSIKMGDRSPETVAAKNALRKELLEMVDTLFFYVLNTGLPIEDQLSSGFPMAKVRTNIGDLPMPVNFNAHPSSKKTVKCISDAVKGAHSYIYQYKLESAPVANWVTVVDTRCNTYLKELTQGACYEFRMCAVGAKGCGEFSDVMSCYVM